MSISSGIAVIGLPAFRDSRSPSSVARDSMRSAIAWSISARSRGVVRDHAGKAVAATSTACATSSALADGISVMTDPSAGSRI